MNNNKDRAKNAFIKYCDAWGSREPNTLQYLKELVAKDFTGLGTAKHEVFRNPSELYAQWEKEVQQIGTETYNIIWIKEKLISNSISIVDCEIEWIRTLHRETQSSVVHRVSTVWNISENKCRIVHWHSSAPDDSQEEEVFPGSLAPKLYPEISVLFTDFVGFTEIATSISAKQLVTELNELFMVFDRFTKQKGLEKIKTIGDAYMLTAGLRSTHANHAVQCIEWSKEVLAYLRNRNQYSDIKWNIRIGINTGSAVGGIIGHEKKVFDLWGETVNVAARLEQHSIPNRVNISANTYNLIKDNFECSYRGKVEIKSNTPIDMYLVDL